MELEDETRLVARLLSGDAYALDQFVLAYRRFITAVLSRQANLYSHDVDELYQRFLFHIWEDGYRRLRPWSGRRSLRAYLGAVARNLARDYRRERRWISVDDLACPQTVAAPAFETHDKSDRSKVVETAMGLLSDRDRALIHRRYYQEESYREIAQALDMTVNHVAVALIRAESRLKVILQKHCGGL